MSRCDRSSLSHFTGAVVLFLAGFLAGCASVPSPTPSVDAAPTAELVEVESPDLWSQKIAEWQQRELASRGRAAVVPGPVRFDEQWMFWSAVASPGGMTLLEWAAPNEPRSTLGVAYAEFLAAKQAAVVLAPESHRQLGREIVGWIQRQAQTHYRSDVGGDHWATFAEMLESRGDDCDGLELLVFHLLQELGVPSADVYRAIVYRPADGQYHMVTLWFDDSLDPWVLDPTGILSPEMQRFSSRPEWLPVRLFTESREMALRPGWAPRL